MRPRVSAVRPATLLVHCLPGRGHYIRDAVVARDAHLDLVGAEKINGKIQKKLENSMKKYENFSIVKSKINDGHTTQLHARIERNVGGVHYEARSRGRSSLDSLAF